MSITVEELDKKIAVLNTVVDRIENNHLEHIKKDIDKLDFRIWAILTGVIVQLSATVFSFVF
jgi:MoaA/NifB/PqqE/SkfB family radical SAM enzyme|tara:strand:+ start:308 stop:493 length:186 start_codon:yes stop_codon:yes gene_type:complete